MNEWLAIAKSRLYLVMPHRWMFALFAFLLRRNAHINFTLPAADLPPQPLFLVNYRGQYITAVDTETPCDHNAHFRHDTIIHFSSPLKSHRSEDLNTTLIDRRIGAPVKLISDVLLREHVDHPQFIAQNFKRQQLTRLGVDRILVYAYPKIDAPFTAAKNTTVELYHDPEGYFDVLAQLFTEQALLPKIARYVGTTRNARGLLVIDDYQDLTTLLRQIRLTFTAYSYGGEFLHMVRNCLVTYLQPAFTVPEIARILDQVTVISAGSNNPVLNTAPNFRAICLVNYYDEHVIKKLDLRAYYPSAKARRADHVVCTINPSATLVWLDIPYHFLNLSYDNETRVLKQLTNYQFHLERAYFNPLYFPDIAYQALLGSVQDPSAR